jgi:hypothetical protein
MEFQALHKSLPYIFAGKEKSVSREPYPNIKLLFPGRHALDTTPIGGDFVVCVTDPAFDRVDHQFTHTDLFKDVEKRGVGDSTIRLYSRVIQGEDPHGTDLMLDMGCYWHEGTIDRFTFLFAVQCLAVAEHRRYARYEKQFGGRYLPFRFAAGISEGLWTAADAASMQKKGRPGVEILEKMNGTPKLTQELMI